MTSATQTLSEEMEKLLSRISEDLMSTLVNLDGSLKDIECGTRIKIPMDAGYVNCFRSQKDLEITVFLKDKLVQIPQMIDQDELEYQTYLQDAKEELNSTKSD